MVDLDARAEAGGGWNGSITIPSLGIKGAALSDIKVEAGNVSFAIANALADQRTGPARFAGHFTADGKVTGDFVQAGNTAPFALTKIGPPQVEPSRRSTSVAKEFEGVWKGAYDLLGYPRTVTLELQNNGGSGASADFVIVGRKENKLPVDRVMQEGTFVTVDSHETGLTFEGRLTNGALIGTILQGPLEIAVTLRRDK